jgi:hypothetical protein
MYCTVICADTMRRSLSLSLVHPFRVPVLVTNVLLPSLVRLDTLIPQFQYSSQTLLEYETRET